jgi:hypothetical protein
MADDQRVWISRCLTCDEAWLSGAEDCPPSHYTCVDDNTEQVDRVPYVPESALDALRDVLRRIAVLDDEATDDTSDAALMEAGQLARHASHQPFRGRPDGTA